MKRGEWGWGGENGDGAGRAGMGRVQHKIHTRPITHGGYDFYTHPRPITRQTYLHPRLLGADAGRVSRKTRPTDIPRLVRILINT